MGNPAFSGVSPHVVESAVLGSTGATRFVVYTTAGEAISETGELHVTFSSPSLADGMLSVSGVMASNGSGAQVAAAPNGLPVIIPHSPAYQSAQVGTTTTLSATAYDLDGAIGSLSFKEDDSPFATVFTFDPGTTTWTPSASGSFAISATASDLSGGETTTDFGLVRAYHLADLATFADFESIHFGPAADPSLLGFGAKPFGHGIANGLAWLLGINPNAPDFSRLPWGSVESNGPDKDFVFRFNRLVSLPGADWSVLESPDLTELFWNPVPGAWITETPLGDGTVDVEVRKPIDPETELKAFLTLEATGTP